MSQTTIDQAERRALTGDLYDEFLTWAQRAGLMQLDPTDADRLAFMHVAGLMRRGIRHGEPRSSSEILAALEADGILTVTETPACEHVTETWGPHPGCKEFMAEPETWRCAAAATHRVSWPDFDGFEEFEGHRYLCAEHAFDAMLLNLEPAQPYGQGLAHVEELS